MRCGVRSALTRRVWPRCSSAQFISGGALAVGKVRMPKEGLCFTGHGFFGNGGDPDTPWSLQFEDLFRGPGGDSDPATSLLLTAFECDGRMLPRGIPTTIVRHWTKGRDEGPGTYG
eukprot:Hpha_TRINITY_DN33808_c0_g1::TRINITY_DN33808_c0_g1_i1::g.27493::m.27493